MQTDARALESKISRRFAPFVAVGLLALFAVLIPPRPSDWTWVWIAGALTVVIAVSGFLIPWSKLPRWTYIVPPLAYFVVVALLRQANDGSASGYGTLLLLPIIWIALNLGRRELVLGIAVGTSVIVLPLIVGDPDQYVSGDWRRALLWSATAAIAGFSIESLMRSKRQQTRAARDHERTMAAIVEVGRALTLDTDAREHICLAALEIADAAVSVIYEPDYHSDELVLTGCAGPDTGHPRLPLRGQPSGTMRAFSTGTRYFVADAVGDPFVRQDTLQRTSSVSMLFEPIVRNGTTIGVLSVGWSRPVSEVDATTLLVVELLALEAAVAIERSDFLARLSDLAETDELTGLPNRRSWDETLRRAVGYATRTHRPLCVGVVDLDYFKRFNDLHGHQAGDRLLKTAAAAWRTELRETDTLVRYGGEEFAIALPGCSVEEAATVLERLRAVTPEGQTCSIGLAEWRPGESGQELVARADEALYQAKHSGRNVLVLA